MTARSVITCDLEGRIETFDEGAERLFGYARGEVVGKKRVSLFSPGLVVLGHVERWLEEARRVGRFSTETVFVRKDGSTFPARIQITPTFRRQDGHRVQVGYCGMTEPLDGAAAVAPPASLATRIFAWLVVTRAPFLTATLAPVLIGAALVASDPVAGPFPWLLFACALLGASALHVSANTFNDYFDWTSGTDQLNNDYFTPFSGGSRSIELGLVSERGLLRLAVAALIASAVLAAPVLAAHGAPVLAFGLAGAFLAYFYTAPPLRLSARRGLGELSVGLAFGPLLVAGTVAGLTGEVRAAHFLAGVPIGLLTAAILWINEFPDAPADALAGKRHLVVVLGCRAARWGYLALVLGAYAVIAVLVLAGVLGAGALAALVALPLAWRAWRVVLVHYDDRELVAANSATIALHACAGLAMAAGLLWL
jgi:1,4-dihydroxy-2-naphthoate octaprenyltransferase